MTTTAIPKETPPPPATPEATPDAMLPEEPGSMALSPEVGIMIGSFFVVDGRTDALVRTDTF